MPRPAPLLASRRSPLGLPHPPAPSQHDSLAGVTAEGREPGEDGGVTPTVPTRRGPPCPPPRRCGTRGKRPWRRCARGVRATRRRGWLLLALGIALAGSCAVGRAAGARPGRPASVRPGRGLAGAAVLDAVAARGRGAGLARERAPGPGRHGAGGASAACGSPATGCAKRSTTATSRPSPSSSAPTAPAPVGSVKLPCCEPPTPFPLAIWQGEASVGMRPRNGNPGVRGRAWLSPRSVSPPLPWPV